jgi:hypothetical protein
VVSRCTRFLPTLIDRLTHLISIAFRDTGTISP